MDCYNSGCSRSDIRMGIVQRPDKAEEQRGERMGADRRPAEKKSRPHT